MEIPQMFVCWTFLTLVVTAYVNLACAESKMKTLYLGPVHPPAPGEQFDKRAWLKSALPKKEDRCQGTNNQKGGSISITTYSATDWIRYPAQGYFTSPLTRFEFSIETQEIAYFDVYGVDGELHLKFKLALDHCLIQSFPVLTSDHILDCLSGGRDSFWMDVLDINDNKQVHFGKVGVADDRINVYNLEMADLGSIQLASDAQAVWEIKTPLD